MKDRLPISALAVAEFSAALIALKQFRLAEADRHFRALEELGWKARPVEPRQPVRCA